MTRRASEPPEALLITFYADCRHDLAGHLHKGACHGPVIPTLRNENDLPVNFTLPSNVLATPFVIDDDGVARIGLDFFDNNEIAMMDVGRH